MSFVRQFCVRVSLTFVRLDEVSNVDSAGDYARVVISHVANRAMNVT